MSTDKRPKCPFNGFSACQDECALRVKVLSDDGRTYETCAITMRALWESDSAKCFPPNTKVYRIAKYRGGNSGHTGWLDPCPDGTK